MFIIDYNCFEIIMVNVCVVIVLVSKIFFDFKLFDSFRFRFIIIYWWDYVDVKWYVIFFFFYFIDECVLWCM